MAVASTVPQTIFLGLPSVVWSGVIGAAMALIGTLGAVVATNWGNTRRLEAQLNHDANERVKERLASLRRDLYLKAVEANVRGLEYFGNLPQVDFTKPDASIPIQNVFAIGAQLQLVASQGAAQLISDLISAYGELQFKLLAKVLPMHDLRAGIDVQTIHYDNVQLEIKRLLMAMKQYNESGQNDRGLFTRLNQSFEFAQKMAKQYSDERSNLSAERIALQRQFANDLIPDIKLISELQTRVLVELRRELDVGGDIEIFSRMMRKQSERAEKAFHEFDSDFFKARPDPHRPN